MQLTEYEHKLHESRIIDVSHTTKHAILNRAALHIFSTGLGDASSLLARENMKYGLAKLHFIQAKFALEPNATFISTPDEGITRNIKRWESGFSYGGKVSWGDGKDKLVVLDTKPNACGMLVGGLDEVPKVEDLIRAVYSLEREENYIDGIKLQWDFNQGNHFIDVFEVKNQKKIKFPYVVIIHSGCPELKGDNKKGFGLYWHKSQILFEMAEKIHTPFGLCYVLSESKAKEYFKFFDFAKEFAMKRRAYIYERIFGGKKPICNVLHQGLVNMNEIVLGCQIVSSERQILPISIRADMPSYLVHGRKNFTAEQVEDMGFTRRAEELGVYDRLRKVNIIPHGGGYMLQDSLKVERVFEVNGKRFFDIEMIDGVGKKIISNLDALEFAYRSTEVMARVEQLGLAKFATELTPLFCIKI